MDTFYAGLDISSKQTSIAIVNIQGKFVFETTCDTEPEAIVRVLTKSEYALEKIGLESGNLTFWLLDEMKAQGLNAICIDSVQMAKLLSLKVNKTDKNDARAIAEAMRCNLYKEVHHKTREAVDVGVQMSARKNLVNTRTQLKNNIRGLLKAYGIRLEVVSHNNFAKEVREAMQGCSEGFQIAIESSLQVYETVCQKIEVMEVQIDKLREDDPVVKLLESIPGVGRLTAMTYKAAIDDPHRFKDPDHVACYLGLTPRQHSSGETVIQGAISKRGHTELRTLLIECGVVLLTRTKYWCKLKAWGLKIMKKKGLKKAATAVARKLAVIMLLMWQRGEAFKWGDDEPENNKKTTQRKKTKKEETQNVLATA